MGRNEPIFRFEIGNGGKIYDFHSHEKISEFIARERSFYSRVADSPALRRPDLSGLRDAIYRNFGLMVERHALWQGDPNAKEGLSDAFRQIYVNWQLPLSTSPKGKFIDNLLTQYGPLTAGAALAVMVKTFERIDINDAEVVRGIFAASAFDTGLHDKNRDFAKEELDDLSTSLTHTIVEVSDQTREKLEQVDRSETNRQRFIWRVALRFARQQRQQRARHSRSIIEAIEKIESTRETYEKLMQLRGPVEYWSTKSLSHRNKAKDYRTTLLAFAGIASAILTLALVSIAIFAFHHASTARTDQPASVYLVLVTLGVVLTTMAFWAARVLVRLFMSEHHLAVDAEERATMVKTYLALIEKNAADEKERALVLASLFRPTSDGIIKDDAAPDMSPASLLSKVLNRP